MLGNGVPLGTLRDKVRFIYSLEEGPGLDVEYGGGLVLMTEVGGLCLAGRTVWGAYSTPSHRSFAAVVPLLTIPWA